MEKDSEGIAKVATEIFTLLFGLGLGPSLLETETTRTSGEILGRLHATRNGHTRLDHQLLFDGDRLLFSNPYRYIESPLSLSFE